MQEKQEIIEKYEKRDESSENILKLAMEQEGKYSEMKRDYKVLESEWKSMEAYIQGLYEY